MARFLRNPFFLLVALFGVTLIAGTLPAWANAVPVPISIGAHSSVPTGLQSTVTFDARGAPAAANAGYYSRPVLISNNTLGGLAKGLARRAAPIAAFALAVEAAGWAIDELTGQVMAPPVGSPPPEPGVGVYCGSAFGPGQAGKICGPSPASFIGTNVGWSGGTYTVTGYSQSPFLRLIVNNGQVGGMQLLFTPYVDNDPWLNYVPASPVPQVDLAPLIKDNPGLWDAALKNPDGSVNRNPDVQAAANALAAELANTSAPQPDPTAEWDTGQQGGPATGNTTAPVALEFPVFCTWAAKVCELVDFLKDTGEDIQPDSDEIEEIPLVLDQSWTSGFSGGGCPPPISLNLLGSEVIFPYEPMCDLAVYIKPLVLAASALMAVMIIGGFRRAS